DGRLDRRERQLELSVRTGGGELVSAARASPRGPVFVGDVQAFLARGGDSGDAQVGLLDVPERATRNVRPGEVREVDVAHPEEGELEAVGPPARVGEVPRVVPPLDGDVGVRTVVAGERDGGRSRRQEREEERE